MNVALYQYYRSRVLQDTCNDMLILSVKLLAHPSNSTNIMYFSMSHAGCGFSAVSVCFSSEAAAS